MVRCWARMLFVAEQSASMLGSAACASPPAPNPAVQRWLEKQFARRFPTLSPLALIVIQCAANCNRTSVPLLKALGQWKVGNTGNFLPLPGDFFSCVPTERSENSTDASPTHRSLLVW
jgi:hypothetical protein